MKLKQLESALQDVPAFANPKFQLEQYPTSAHIASRLLYTAQNSFEDIESCSVADLGIGCGVLSTGACLLDSAYNIGLDIDQDAISQSRQTLADFECAVDIVRLNVQDIVESHVPHKDMKQFRVDTVIMNPPFGTKNKGVDLDFLRFATMVLI